MALSFKEYNQQRNEAFEIFKRMATKAKAATGYESEEGKRDLAVHTGLDATKKGLETAQGVGGIATSGVKLATNIATGNVVGAAVSVWQFVKSIASAGVGLKSLSKAGALVQNVLKQKEALTAHLKEKVDEQNVKRIVDAIFEVDVNAVDDLPPSLWPIIIEDFMTRLGTGYDNLEKKILATVAYENLQKWLEKYGAQSAELENELSQLMKDRQEKLQIVAQPQIQAVVQDFGKEEKKPKEGDMAYSKYRGYKYVGPLKGVDYGRKGATGHIEDHGHKIYVGYDEPIEWDEKEGMWKAPADYD